VEGVNIQNQLKGKGKERDMTQRREKIVGGKGNNLLLVSQNFASKQRGVKN